MERNTGVSIVTHDTDADQLRKALRCVLSSAVVAAVMVVDNSDSDRLRTVASECGAEYRHVANRGFGAGHNEAIREFMARGYKYHLVMNADVWWNGDVPGAMASYLDSDALIGMAMPKVFYPDGDLQYACRMLPTPLDVIGKRFLPASLMRRRIERYLLANADHDRAFNVPYLLGSFLFFRMYALRREGMFDERFFMYPEDIDITRRIHRHWKTMYWPGAEIVHEHAAGSRHNRKLLMIHITNMIRYFNKWGWWADAERHRFNHRLLRDMPTAEGVRPNGRG